MCDVGRHQSMAQAKVVRSTAGSAISACEKGRNDDDDDDDDGGGGGRFTYNIHPHQVSVVHI